MKANIIFLKNLSLPKLFAIIFSLVIIVTTALFFSMLIILLLPVILLIFLIFKLILRNIIKKSTVNFNSFTDLNTKKEYIDAKYTHVNEENDQR